METIYKRMSDESFDDYVWRICSNKDNGKYELTWDEVGIILNKESEEEYTSSKWRKNYQNEKRGYERAIEKNMQSQDSINEIRMARMELEVERKKKQTDSVFYNRIFREHSREEMLKEKVVDAVKNADKIPLPEFNQIKSDTGEISYILGFSDVHAYKIFKSLTNEYSKSILESRMAELMQEVIKVVDKESLAELVVINGGDDLEGILRISALSILELGVMDTVIEYRKFMAKWLSDLSKHVKIKYIQMISSNHTESRPLGS